MSNPLNHSTRRATMANVQIETVVAEGTIMNQRKSEMDKVLSKIRDRIQPEFKNSLEVGLHVYDFISDFNVFKPHCIVEVQRGYLFGFIPRKHRELLLEVNGKLLEGSEMTLDVYIDNDDVLKIAVEELNKFAHRFGIPKIQIIKHFAD